jgi:hypothetical protein
MKQLLFIVFCLFVACDHSTQTDTIRERQFQLKGRIIGEVELTAGCGFVAFGTVIEFDVIKLQGMRYQNNHIGIIITCPRDYDEGFFEKGKTYQIVFSDKNQANFEWIIVNKDLLKKNGLSFDPYAIEVKKMP